MLNDRSPAPPQRGISMKTDTAMAVSQKPLPKAPSEDKKDKKGKPGKGSRKKQDGKFVNNLLSCGVSDMPQQSQLGRTTSVKRRSFSFNWFN